MGLECENIYGDGRSMVIINLLLGVFDAVRRFRKYENHLEN